MDSKSLIEIIEYERKKLTHFVNIAYTIDSEAQINKHMNIKELLGHVSWYESQILQVLKENEQSENNFENLSTDEKNQQISLLYKNKSFEDVKMQSDRVFNELIKNLSYVTDEQLVDETLLTNNENKRKPWQLLIENSFIHYEEHIAGIKRWLKDST